MTLKQLELWHWVAAAVLVAIVALTAGCSSARPYTAKEKTWLTHAIIGQSLDVVTTDMAMHSGKFDEMNGLWWDPQDAGSLLAGKFAIMGVGYLVGQWKPEWRTTIWTAFGVSGYGLATWNTYQMIEHDAKPWGEK